MARIKNTVVYTFDTVPSLSDFLVGSNQEDGRVTKSYRIDALFGSILPALGYITDAPDDGQPYVRQSESWVQLPSGSRSSGDVFSVFGRTGAVTARVEDYQSFYAALSHRHDWTDLDGVPSEFNPSAHTHTTSEITDLDSYTGFDSRYFTETESDNRFATLNHTHTESDITDLGNYLEFVNISDINTTGTPSATNFLRGDGAWTTPVLSAFGRTGAVTADADDYAAFYASLSHTHTEADITDLQSYLTSVNISDINATGSPGPNTWLRGDGTWGVITAGVASVFGRVGAISAEVGDYSAFYAALSHTHTTSEITDLSSYTGFDSRYQLLSEKGAANGYVPLNSSGQIDSRFLPAFVDDVLEFADLASFPATGETGKIYLTLDTNLTYRWSGSTYVQVGGGQTLVDSVFGRTGVITALSSDYSAFYAPLSHTHDWAEITGKPTTFTPSTHTHTTSDITNLSSYTGFDSRYLGISAKAADSELLDGINSSLFARLDQNNVFDAGASTSIRIHANDGSSPSMRFTKPLTGTGSTDGFQIGLDSSTASAYVIQRENADIFFRTNNVERARFLANGDINFVNDVILTTERKAFRTGNSTNNSNFRTYNSNDSDITSIVSGSDFGGLIEAAASGHLVVGLKPNDTSDGFHVITRESGGSTYTRRVASFYNKNIDFNEKTNIRDSSDISLELSRTKSANTGIKFSSNLTDNSRMYGHGGTYAFRFFENSTEISNWNSNDVNFFTDDLRCHGKGTDAKVEAFRDGSRYGHVIANSSGAAIVLTKPSSSPTIIRSYGTSDFHGGNLTVHSGNVTANNFILSSDERFKDNIQPYIPSEIKINWKQYELKGEKRIGVIAQELEKEHPEFVETNDEGFKAVAYIDLLVAKNAELEARITKLESLIEKLN